MAHIHKHTHTHTSRWLLISHLWSKFISLPTVRGVLGRFIFLKHNTLEWWAIIKEIWIYMREVLQLHCMPTPAKNSLISPDLRHLSFFLLWCWCESRNVPPYEDDVTRGLAIIQQVNKGLGVIWTHTTTRSPYSDHGEVFVFENLFDCSVQYWLWRHLLASNGRRCSDVVSFLSQARHKWYQV